MPPKEDQATSRAKTQLGWGDDNAEEYRKWRRHLKAYALMNKITGRRGTSDAAWEAFKTFAMDAKNGLPASGRKLLTSAKGDKDGEKARQRFHHLLLDSLKKDRETEVKEGLAAAALQRENAANDSDKEGGSQPIVTKSVIVRVVIVDPDNETDVSGDAGYCWATAKVRQFVALKDIAVVEIFNGIRARIPEERHIRAIYGAVSKPPLDGTDPDDIERIVSDEDLTNFVMVAKGVYKPLMVQLQLASQVPKEDDPETPPPDEREYFNENHFDIEDTTYDPAVSDSEDELYLMKFGKRKAKAWPRSDHGFEHKKAKMRKRMNRMRKEFVETKKRHKKFMGPKADEIVDSDEEEVFSWMRWLNPQSGKDFVRARAAAQSAADAYGANPDDEKMGEAAAKASFGKRQKGDFNEWLDDSDNDVEEEEEGDSD
jgi:hypothetical protein